VKLRNLLKKRGLAQLTGKVLCSTRPEIRKKSAIAFKPEYIRERLKEINPRLKKAVEDTDVPLPIKYAAQEELERPRKVVPLTTSGYRLKSCLERTMRRHAAFRQTYKKIEKSDKGTATDTGRWAQQALIEDIVQFTSGDIAIPKSHVLQTRTVYPGDEDVARLVFTSPRGLYIDQDAGEYLREDTDIPLNTRNVFGFQGIKYENSGIFVHSDRELTVEEILSCDLRNIVTWGYNVLGLIYQWYDRHGNLPVKVEPNPHWRHPSWSRLGSQLGNLVRIPVLCRLGEQNYLFDYQEILEKAVLIDGSFSKINYKETIRRIILDRFVNSIQECDYEYLDQVIEDNLYKPEPSAHPNLRSVPDDLSQEDQADWIKLTSRDLNEVIEETTESISKYIEESGICDPGDEDFRSHLLLMSQAQLGEETEVDYESSDEDLDFYDSDDEGNTTVIGLGRPNNDECWDEATESVLGRTYGFDTKSHE
jgi:hypothetical protein